MKKIILIKKIEGLETFDKITISFGDFHYSLTCSFVKDGKSSIYLRNRQPDYDNMRAFLMVRIYKNEGYKIIKGSEYAAF